MRPDLSPCQGLGRAGFGAPAVPADPTVRYDAELSDLAFIQVLQERISPSGQPFEMVLC